MLLRRLQPSRLFMVLVIALFASRVAACPFCAAEGKTLTEELADASVGAIGRLAAPSLLADELVDADVPAALIDPETGAALFAIESILVGADLLEGIEEVEAIYFGDADVQKKFFLRGMGTPPEWAIPLPLSDAAVEYMAQLEYLPIEGANRLAFFQEYLEHEDPVLAQDAYDEFARAPYQAVIDLAPRMNREQLLDWIESPEISPSRRRLFLTMLGVCGVAEDQQRIEAMLTADGQLLSVAAGATTSIAMASGASPAAWVAAEAIQFSDRSSKTGLDALVACYLSLAGKHGDPAKALDLIDDRFLRDLQVEYSHVYAVLQALRFLAEEQQELVPLDRVLRSARLLLNHPDFADQIIPDLARWEDWAVLEQLAAMYQATFDTEAENAPAKYVREPIITYLDVASEQLGEVGDRAQRALAEIEPLDPDTVQRARSLRDFGFLALARAGTTETIVPDEINPDIPVELEPLPEEAEPAETTTLAEPEPEIEPTTAPAEPAPPRRVASEQPLPPSKMMLVGVPLAATAALIALFWLILRGGVS